MTRNYTNSKCHNQLILLLVLAAIHLSGCAVMPDNWAFTKQVIQTDKLDQVKRIALLDVPPPENIHLGPLISDDAMFWVGFFGAVTIENTEGNILTSRSWVADTTQKELKNWLEQTGIEVVLVEAEREKESKMLKDYGQFAQVDADAVLEVAFISIGFVDERGKVDFCWIPPCDSKKPLSPEVLYKYRLVSAKSGEVLVQSNVSYSSFVGQYTGKGVKLLGPEEHIFKGSESVVNQPEEANRRLQHAIKGATELIANVVTGKSEVPISVVPGKSEEPISMITDKPERPISRGFVIGNWRGEIESSGHNTYRVNVTIFNEMTARYKTASGSKGRILFYSINDTGKWEGYWIGSRPSNVCPESKEGSRNWGVVVWQFEDINSGFKGTWDFCGEGRKFSWSGRR